MYVIRWGIDYSVITLCINRGNPIPYLNTKGDDRLVYNLFLIHEGIPHVDKISTTDVDKIS